MSKLKFAGVAKQGETIRALDFAHVPDTYIEGVVLEESAAHPEQGVPCFKISVTDDVRQGSPYEGRGTRVGDIAWVPHEVAFLESDSRVTKVQGSTEHRKIIDKHFAAIGVGKVLRLEHLQWNSYAVIWRDFELDTEVRTICIIRGDECVADTHGVTLKKEG